MNTKFLAYAIDFASFLIENSKNVSEIKQIILFGSAARGESDEKSDIDLFIEVTNKKKEKEIESIKEKFYKSVKYTKYWNLLGIQNEINCSIGKLEEWDDLQRSLIAQGLILYGKYKGTAKTDQYYLFTLSPGKKRNENISLWRALYGYKQEINKKKYEKLGLVKEIGGKKLARAVFIIPTEQTQNMIAFLKKKKCKYTLIPFWKEQN